MEPLSSYRPSRYSQQNCNLKQKKNKKQKTSQGWKALRCIAKADLLIHPVFLVFLRRCSCSANSRCAADHRVLAFTRPSTSPFDVLRPQIAGRHRAERVPVIPRRRSLLCDRNRRLSLSAILHADHKPSPVYLPEHRHLL